MYRTPIGFHDAYVAAPSQKAAIAAWGSDKAVFARGQAELVADPELTAAPLASPGTVIKRLRGSAAEQIAALGQSEKPAEAKGARDKRPRPAPKRDETTPKPKPRPSRAALDEAEQALAAAAARHHEQRKALAEREAALARERKALAKTQAQERGRLEGRRDKAEAAYDRRSGAGAADAKDRRAAARPASPAQAIADEASFHPVRIR